MKDDTTHGPGHQTASICTEPCHKYLVPSLESRLWMLVLPVAEALTVIGCNGGNVSNPTTLQGDAATHSADPISDAAPGSVVDAASAADSAIDDGGAVGPPLVSSPACVDYCNLLPMNCSGEAAQFASAEACLRACSFYPPGADDDNSGLGNTLRCRIQHATSAAGYIGHCWHAGAFGFGGCGATCEGFCQVAMDWCGLSTEGAPFASADACATECGAFTYAPSTPDGYPSLNAQGPTSGNTLDCRAYELVKSLESVAARDEHCPHAATNSTTCQ